MNNLLPTSGKRIKYIRDICGLSRRKFAENYSLKEFTLRSWELDISEISNNSIKKLTLALYKEGIICSEEWIKTGIGDLPYSIKGNLVAQNKFSLACKNQSETNNFFNSSDNIVHVIDDECNIPIYRPGDIISGTKILYSNKIYKHIGELCIVPIDGSLKLRIIRPSSKDNKITLTSLKCESETISCKILYDVEIEFFCPIQYFKRIN